MNKYWVGPRCGRLEWQLKRIEGRKKKLKAVTPFSSLLSCSTLKLTKKPCSLISPKYTTSSHSHSHGKRTGCWLMKSVVSACCVSNFWSKVKKLKAVTPFSSLLSCSTWLTFAKQVLEEYALLAQTSHWNAPYHATVLVVHETKTRKRKPSSWKSYGGTLKNSGSSFKNKFIHQGSVTICSFFIMRIDATRSLRCQSSFNTDAPGPIWICSLGNVDNGTIRYPAISKGGEVVPWDFPSIGHKAEGTQVQGFHQGEC